MCARPLRGLHHGIAIGKTCAPQEREDAAVSEHAVIDAFAWGSIVEGGPLDTESELDRRLSVGASISCRVRGAIREKLGETAVVLLPGLLCSQLNSHLSQ